MLTALVGIITTSAFADRHGILQWNPLISIQWMQANYYTSSCRAASFFAGVGLLSVTIFINYTQNSVASGMDMAMLLPKYLSQRRGAILFGILGILANRPVTAAGHLHCPAMFVVADADSIAPPGAVRSAAAKARRAGNVVEVLELSCGHFDIYDGEPFETSVARQVTFLEKVLA